MAIAIPSPTPPPTWQKLGKARTVQLPLPLLEALRLSSGRFIRTKACETEFEELPSIDVGPIMQAFTALGRCPVAVALYNSGAIQQIQYGEKSVRLVREGESYVVYGRLEAGYFHLLIDTYVMPHKMNCWWRLTGSHFPREPEPIAAVSESKEVLDASLIACVQNLDVDGDGFAPGVEPPIALRSWLPHQRRSFRWMLHREKVRDLFVCESSTGVPTGLPQLSLEWKMDKAFDLRGGMLCDPVGSGKSATVLGLVLHDDVQSEWAYEGADAARDNFSGSWQVANATLLLCPDQVHEQWLAEVGRCFPDAALHVLPIRTVAELRQASAALKALTGEGGKPRSSPTLVVVALSVLRDDEYAKLLSLKSSELSDWWGGLENEKQGLALDCFVWRRLVIDEVHELVHVCDPSSCPKVCRKASLVQALRTLRSERRWGLSGTAHEILRDVALIQCLAQIFRSDFNSYSSSRRFVEHYCRTNSVSLPVPVSEQVELVEHSVLERIIYQQHARDFSMLGIDGTGEKNLTAEELVAVVPLLKLCSHFNIPELTAANDGLEEFSGSRTASEAVLQLHRRKAAVLESAVKTIDENFGLEQELMAREDNKPSVSQVWVAPTDLAPRLQVEPQKIDGETVIIVTRVIVPPRANWSDLQAGDHIIALGGQPVFQLARDLWSLRLTLEAEAARGDEKEELEKQLQDIKIREQLAEAFNSQVRDRTGVCETIALSWRPARRKVANQVIHGIVASRAACMRQLASQHQEWRGAEASFGFLHSLWETLSCGSAHRRECPVCLDTFDAESSGVVLRCAHVYCDTCSGIMFARGSSSAFRSARCPVCRVPVVNETDMVSLKEFAKSRAAAAAEAVSIGVYGSKVERLIHVLRGILASSSSERAIVFCQFADLEEQVSGALDDAQLPHARLSTARDVFQQTAVLDSFQQKIGSQRVLLLSLEQSASGTNLTAANHVLLVHPMAASTPERAAAFEQQAIGRCVRLGQTKPVTVWRFVTKGTVEEVLDGRLSAWRQPRKETTASERKKQLLLSSLPADMISTQRGGSAGTRGLRSKSLMPAGNGGAAARSLREGGRRGRRSAPSPS